jgi:NAD(P)-dependent dehydrogenase (short-subunit alcohol dehydrogenase family)
MAAAFCESGATVLLNGRDPEKLARLADTLSQTGGKAVASAWDVVDEAEVANAIRHIEDTFGRLDVLVNNAAAARTGTIETTTTDEFRSVYEVCVVSAHRLIQGCRELLISGASRSGVTSSIVNVSTMYGSVSPDGRIYGTSGHNSAPSYGAAKAALNQLTRYAACNLAPQKIRVNAISPGPFPHVDLSIMNSDFHKKLCDKTPMGRVATADEIVGPLLFLASNASSYVNGINLAVDGGWTAW